MRSAEVNVSLKTPPVPVTIVIPRSARKRTRDDLLATIFLADEILTARDKCKFIFISGTPLSSEEPRQPLFDKIGSLVTADGFTFATITQQNRRPDTERDGSQSGSPVQHAQPYGHKISSHFQFIMCPSTIS